MNCGHARRVLETSRDLPATLTRIFFLLPKQILNPKRSAPSEGKACEQAAEERCERARSPNTLVVVLIVLRRPVTARAAWSQAARAFCSGGGLRAADRASTSLAFGARTMCGARSILQI
jgi:hypothetical protein